MIIIPDRARPRGPAANRSDTFTGTVWADPLLPTQDGVTVANVFFAPGARTFWHHHERGQLLHVVAGSGLIRSDGGPVESIRAGDLIWVPPGERHWHGAGPDNYLVHIAVSLGTTVWGEEVADDADGGREGTGATRAGGDPSPSRRPAQPADAADVRGYRAAVAGASGLGAGAWRARRRAWALDGAAAPDARNGQVRRAAIRGSAAKSAMEKPMRRRGKSQMAWTPVIDSRMRQVCRSTGSRAANAPADRSARLSPPAGSRTDR